jgi:hypothetical protein
MTLSEGMQKEVLGVIDDYVRFYNERNAEKVLSLFAKNISGFGTGKEEVVTNFPEFRDRLRQDFGPANAIRISIDVLITGGEMPVAWVSGFCTFGGKIAGDNVRMEGRMTAVLVNRGGRWLFEQVHFSVPDAA